MGHVKYMAAVADLPPAYVYELADLEKSDPRRRVAFPFARKLTKSPKDVEQADIDTLRTAFTDREIVQLVFAICHFNTMNRLADAFGVPLERTNVFQRPPAPKEQPPAPAGRGLPPPRVTTLKAGQAATK
jgi:uncharacterized protein YciW